MSASQADPGKSPRDADTATFGSWRIEHFSDHRQASAATRAPRPGAPV